MFAALLAAALAAAPAPLDLWARTYAGRHTAYRPVWGDGWRVVLTHPMLARPAGAQIGRVVGWGATREEAAADALRKFHADRR